MQIFKTPLVRKKGCTIPHEKCFFLLDMIFLVKEIISLTSKLTYRKKCFLSIVCSQGCWVMVEKLPSLGLLESSAVLGLTVVFREAYNIDILQV
jgi:hypothetical protein